MKKWKLWKKYPQMIQENKIPLAHRKKLKKN